MMNITENMEIDDVYSEITPKLFRKRLRKLLADNDCDNKQFAEKAGISRDVVTRATTHGIVPSLRVLIKMADFLNVSLNYMLALSDENFFYKADKPTPFLDRLEELRNETGLKYSEIARTIDFPGNLFYDWKNRNLLPSFDNLQTLARFFNVTNDYLLGRTDERD